MPGKCAPMRNEPNHNLQLSGFNTQLTDINTERTDFTGVKPVRC